MANEWAEVMVGSLAAPVKNALVGGPFGSNLVSRDYVDYGVPVIRGQNMGSRWVAGEFAYVSPEKAEELSPNTAHPGDLVFTQRGTLGQVAIVPEGPFERYIVSQSQMKLTADVRKVDALFLYYFFSSEEQQNYIQRNAIQTGVPHTNLEHLRTSPVQLPPLTEQRAIAHILGTLDDKIELNRRINETLEAVARALFRSWFVDFDPVQAKAEGRQPVGMDAEMAALFPDAFDFGQQARLPTGWHMDRLEKYLTELETGSRPAGGASETSEIPSIGAESVRGIGYFDFSKTKYVSRVFYESMSRGHVRREDVLIYKDGGKPGEHPGKKSLVDRDFPFEECCINEHVYRVRVRYPLSQHYLYFWLDTPYATDQIIQRAVGVAQPGLNRDAVQSLPVLLPGAEIVSAFDRTVRPLCNQVFENCKQSQTLAGVRDALLPKLLSGQIRVTDAEHIVSAAV